MSELNAIEQIEKLYAKPKSYNIPKVVKPGQVQVKMNIVPLGLDDLGVMNIKKDAPMSEVSKNAIKMISLSLKISEAQAGKLSFEYMQDLLDAIMSANNFKEEDAKSSGISKFLKDKREQIAKQKAEEAKPEEAKQVKASV